MTDDDAETTVRVLAEQFGQAIAPEHFAETVAAWRLMAPHLERVRDASLSPEIEPAALFRP